MIGKGNVSPRPGIFGEILVDKFPDGTRVLGGSALNVAWHLVGIGLDPILVSSVGDDALGVEVIEKLENWGLDISGIQKSERHPTGVVDISYAKDGEPVYQSALPLAFDSIEYPQAQDALKASSLLYHGSYIARAEDSKNTLCLLRRNLTMPVFIDVNLRYPYWSKNFILELIKGVKWAKFTLEELAAVLGEDPQVLAGDLTMARKLSIPILIVSDGEKGSSLLTDDGVFHFSAKRMEIVDQVGAGDALCAAFLAGYLHGWDEIDILEQAVSFATSTCCIRGAVIENRNFYSPWEKKWESSIAPRASTSRKGTRTRPRDPSGRAR